MDDYEKNLILAQAFIDDSTDGWYRCTQTLRERLSNTLADAIMKKKLKTDPTLIPGKLGMFMAARVYVFTEDEFSNLCKDMYRRGKGSCENKKEIEG